MRQIFASSDLRESDLAALYAYPDGPWLRANMVSSADGAAMVEGLTSGLSSQADRRLFALLRTLADVIVVGAATVRAEKYKPVRQHELWPDLRPGRTPTPPIAVVTARLDLEPSSPVIDMAPPSARTIVITTAQAPADRRAALQERADVIVAGQETVDLKAAVAALAERGHRRMLTEGGPRLLAQIATAGLLDELCLTIGPLLAGPGADRILAGQQPAASAQPLTLAHVLEDNGFLFCRYTRKDHLFRTDHGASPGPGARNIVNTQSGAWVRRSDMFLSLVVLLNKPSNPQQQRRGVPQAWASRVQHRQRDEHRSGWRSSVGLQSGIPLESCIAEVRRRAGEQAGITDDWDIRMASSVMDYVFRRLALEQSHLRSAVGAGHPDHGQRTPPR